LKKDYKQGFIKSLSIVSETDLGLKPELLFFTSYGMVSGTLANYKIEKWEESKEAFDERIAKGEQVSTREVAISILEETIETKKFDNVTGKDELIYLNDAIWQIPNGERIELPEITLFLENIIGVVTGTLKKID